MRLRNIPGAGEAIAACPYVIADYKTKQDHWNTVFEDQNPNTPLHIEVGMGKGQFLFEMARQHPDINYIGIERYTSVLLRAIQKINPEEPPKNLRFICMDAKELPEVFGKKEISRIYLNFSDPWPKDRHARRRLTSSDFLNRYDQILSADGTIEFKTDNRGLFDFSLEEIQNTEPWKITAYTFDLHHEADMCAGNVMTEYEEKFSSIGNPICKLIAQRK
ncbi:MAG: tRNA (guanosine(46)-N7)-methyltransferase TrmB [bacterium]|nr:tRNA (guanosine(46)-N7)-methyltransferase TrmB [bacterium]